MELKFRCPTCDRKLEVDASLSGTTQECPNCHIDVTIPNLALGPGLVVGGYEILKSIGRGAMGEVFLATQLSMGREVALKVLHSQAVTASDFVGRFLHEVRLAAQLEHPNIVTAIDAGEDSGVYWFAMAYVQGMTLDASLIQRGALPEKEALTIGMKIANALEYAWKSRQILHRDIKPANIMLGTDSEPMLMDMGIAKNVHEDSSMTATGMAMGTPHYMSPEQARGSRDLDFRADMYSLGATLYHLVVGEVPFVGGSAVEVVAKHLNDPLPPVRSRNPDVSEGCALVIEKMMAKDRLQRFPDWASCTGAMRRVSKGVAIRGAKIRAARAADKAVSKGHGGRQARVSPETIPTAKPVPSFSGSLRRFLGVAIGILSVLVFLLLFLVLRRSYTTGQHAASASPAPTTNVAGTAPGVDGGGKVASTPLETTIPAVTAPVPSATHTAAPATAPAPGENGPDAEKEAKPVPEPRQSVAETGTMSTVGAGGETGFAVTEPPIQTPVPAAVAAAPGDLKSDNLAGGNGDTNTGTGEDTVSEGRVMPSVEMRTALDNEMDAIVEGILPDTDQPNGPVADTGEPTGPPAAVTVPTAVTAADTPPAALVTESPTTDTPDSPTETTSPVAVEPKLPSLLDQISDELLNRSFASALAVWHADKGTVASEMAPEQFEALEALIRSVVFINQRILDGFRNDIGRTVVIQFRQKKQKFLIKSVSPKGVKGFEIHQHGGIGRTFSARDLDPREKWRRLGGAKDADLEIMRVLILAEARMFDGAIEKARTVESPLGRALLREILKQNK